MTDFDIRVVDPRGADATRLLAALEREKAARVPGWDAEHATRIAPEEIEPPDGAFLVAYRAGRAVGCGAVRRIERDVAELKRLYVEPEVRAHGLGELLMEAMEDTARASGYATVRLDTDPSLAEAQQIFVHRGYRRIPAYNDNPNASAWWEKDL